MLLWLVGRGARVLPLVPGDLFCLIVGPLVALLVAAYLLLGWVLGWWQLGGACFVAAFGMEHGWLACLTLR